MDDHREKVPGAQDVAIVLRRDPLYAVLASRLADPWVLGIVAACIVIAMILLGPSSDSRFIYTDF